MNESPRHILVAVCGMTPQIITETLFGIHQQGAVFPTEIHLITTAEGAFRARQGLIEQGILNKFCHDYDLPVPLLSDDTIHVLHDAAGNAMHDIRKPIENEYMADLIIDLIRELTGVKNTTLHVSLAGGRKTMGYYIGYALSLFGRPQDCLSHVLVAEDYEASAEFWYPTPYPKAMRNYQGKEVDARLADVHLAQIPFVRLRDWLPQPILQEKQSFSEVVANTQQAYQAHGLCIDVANKQLLVNDGDGVALGDVDFAFYWFLARHMLRTGEGIGVLVEGENDPGLGEDFLLFYRRVKGMDVGDADRTTEGLKFEERSTGVKKHGLNQKFIEQRKVAINKALRIKYGALGVERFGIQRQKSDQKSGRYYQIATALDNLLIRE